MTLRRDFITPWALVSRRIVSFWFKGMQGEILDGIIRQGATIIVRAVSGKIVLRIITEIDERCSKLVNRVLQQCAAVLDVPRLCIHLRWKPPVLLQAIEATCVAGFSLIEHSPAVAKKETLLMEATAVITHLSEEQHGTCMVAQSVVDYCLVCCDPAEDVDRTHEDRTRNCVRCTPCSLCDKCKVVIEGQSICLWCIEANEEGSMPPEARRRKILVGFDSAADV